MHYPPTAPFHHRLRPAVLQALCAHGPVVGIKRLALHAESVQGSATGSSGLPDTILADYLRATHELIQCGAVAATRCGESLVLALAASSPPPARTHVDRRRLPRKPLPPASRAVVGVAGVAGIVAGCGLMQPSESSSQSLRQEPLRIAAVAQIRMAPSAPPAWTYCSDACPAPTPKSPPAPAARPIAVAAPAPPATDSAPPPLRLSADILFPFASATLTPTGSDALRALATGIRSGTGVAIKVTGYTDRLGSTAYNLQLSVRRAAAVKDHLVKALPSAEVSSVGLGKVNPISPSECSTIRQQSALITCLQPDRRVEIAVTQTAGGNRPASSKEQR